MKKRKAMKCLITVTLALTCLFILGCNKDNDNDDIPGNYHMTAKINGAAWSSAADQLIVTTMGEYLFISGATSNENETITINFFDFPGNAGNYPIGTGEHDFLCFYSIGDISYYVFDDEPEATGTLVITDITSSSIKGTFSFTGLTNEGDATATVTEGSFYMPIF